MDRSKDSAIGLRDSAFGLSDSEVSSPDSALLRVDSAVPLRDSALALLDSVLALLDSVLAPVDSALALLDSVLIPKDSGHRTDLEPLVPRRWAHGRLVVQAAELPARELVALAEAIDSLLRRDETVADRHAAIAERIANSPSLASYGSVLCRSCQDQFEEPKTLTLSVPKYATASFSSLFMTGSKSRLSQSTRQCVNPRRSDAAAHRDIEARRSCARGRRL